MERILGANIDFLALTFSAVVPAVVVTKEMTQVGILVVQIQEIAVLIGKAISVLLHIHLMVGEFSDGIAVACRQVLQFRS